MSIEQKFNEVVEKTKKLVENELHPRLEEIEKRAEKSASSESLGEMEAKVTTIGETITAFQKEIDELNAEFKSVKFTTGSDKKDTLEADYSAIYRSKLLRTQPGAEPDLTDGEKAIVTEYKAKRMAEMEAKAMNVGTANQGGNMVPTGDANEIMRQVEIKVPFFGISKVVDSDLALTPFLIQTTVQATSVGNETTEVTDSTTPLVEELRVPVWHIEAEPWITVELLEDSKLIDLESFIREDTVEAFADQLGDQLVNGDGTTEPKGILTSGDSSSTYTKVFEITADNTDTNAAGFGLDDLYTVKYNINRRYKSGTDLSWVMGDDVMLAMRKLRDAEGQYLWQPSVQLGEPNVFDGEGVFFSPYMPPLATGSDAIIYGNFKKGHVIVNRPDAMRVVIDEVTQKKYIKFYRKIRVGGNVLDARALRIMKAATVT